MESNSLIGRTIGVYEVVDKIGRGGMAEVYKGFHPALRRYVAIKLLGRSLQADPQISRRFQREAQAVASLRHPNIVQVFDFGSYEGGHYLVMEYVEGTDLRVEIDRRHCLGHPFTPDEVLYLLGQVADALDYAHQRGIIHRDIKPGNILLTTDGQAILSDFGLAMLRDRVSQATVGQALGTPEYIAPEQAMDSRAAVPQSDIYALGGILYEMVTGRVPFEAESSLSLALKHISEDPTPPRHYAPQLPEAVEAIILRALAKDPADRFSTAEEMIRALRQAWSQSPTQPITARPRPAFPAAGAQPLPSSPPSPVIRRLPAAQPFPAPQPAAGEAPHSVVSPVLSMLRRRWPLVAGLLFLLLVGLIGVLAITRGSAPSAVAQATATVTTVLTAPPTQVAALTAPPLSSPSPTTRATSAPIAASSPTAARTATPAPTEPPTTTPTWTPAATPTRASTPTETPLPTPAPALAAGEAMTRSLDGMVMRFVPAGPFLMGADDDPDASSREKPQHEVFLSSFWMDETEVTNDQYRRCVEAGACTEPAKTTAYGDPARGDHPVDFVTWTQADAYCGWLATEAGWDAHLPTEAQWEKAASWDPINGTKLRYPWGDEEPDQARLNYLGSRLGRTAAVGSYPEGTSPYGVLDMAGNVWEWVADWYGKDYYEAQDLPIDPPGPVQGKERVMRGGSYGYGSRYAHTTHREMGDPEKAKGAGLGFRCAVDGERLP